MEKKEMSFIEKFEAARKELEKAIKESKDGAMIMIATSEGNDGVCISASIQGKSSEIASLLAYVAIKNNGFKTASTDAIRCAEAYEQRNK